MSEKVLMSNGVALWLANHTNLSLDQIAEFCGMHPLQVSNMRRDGFLEGVLPCNPIDVSLLTEEEILSCEKNPSARLKGIPSASKCRESAKKSGMLEGLVWVIKNYPDVPSGPIAKLLGCTTAVVKSVQEGAYKKLEEVIPRNPVSLGLCSQQSLDEWIVKYTN